MMTTPKTKANVPPPRPQKQRLAASAPPATMTPDNLSRSTEEIQDLNFKVSSSFHREFKMTAVSYGMSMKELLEAAFKIWKAQNTTGKTNDLFMDRN